MLTREMMLGHMRLMTVAKMPFFLSSRENLPKKVSFARCKLFCGQIQPTVIWGWCNRPQSFSTAFSLEPVLLSEPHTQTAFDGW